MKTFLYPLATADVAHLHGGVGISVGTSMYPIHTFVMNQWLSHHRSREALSTKFEIGKRQPFRACDQ
jgi:hypothetical protein